MYCINCLERQAQAAIVMEEFVQSADVLASALVAIVSQAR